MFRKQSPRITKSSSDKMMSLIMKEMIAHVLPGDDPPEDATNVALLLATVAWNRSLGFPEQKGFVKKQLAKMIPSTRNFWHHFVDKDTKKLIDVLIEYKTKHYSDDNRYIAGASVAEDPKYEEGGHLRVVYVPQEQWKEFFSLSPKEQAALAQSQLSH